MSTTTTIPRDRYQRLTENIEIFADDQNVAAAPPLLRRRGATRFRGEHRRGTSLVRILQMMLGAWIDMGADADLDVSDPDGKIEP
jgi:hypothetical protein